MSVQHTQTSMHHVHKEGELIYIEAKSNLYYNREGKDSFATFTSKTSWELFERRCRELPTADILGYKTKQSDGKYNNSQLFSWYKGQQALELAENISGGIKKVYNLPKKSMVGIFFPNRAEWIIVSQALHRIGLIPIPLYATLGVQSINYIIDLTDIELIVVSSETISKSTELKSKTHQLKYINVDSTVPYSNPMNLDIRSLVDIISIGKSNPTPTDLPSVDDIYSIFFTSGTSGNPKGVVHTHKSFHSAVYCFTSMNIFDKDNVALNRTSYSYLPLAHVFEHEVTYIFVYGYGRVAFMCGGLGCLLSEIQDCQPDHLIAVPRVLQRIKMAMDAYIASSNFVSRLITPPSYLLGKKLKSIINGSAPITMEIYNYFKENLPNCHVLQGYGSTETFGGVCCGCPGLNDPKILSIGVPFLHTTFRIRSVPDMGYLTSNDPPQGELEIKSDNLFKEYYKQPEVTANSFTEDGFFITGDIVKLNVDGTISIIDRRSNLIKLAQGEFVAVENVEQAMISNKISQAFVHGVSTDNFVVAVVVPTKEASDMKEQELLEWITMNLHEKGIPSFAIPRALYIEHTPFSEDNDLLTPSMKLRRANLKKHYAVEIDKMRTKVNDMN
ncbi:long-chain-fatty-acid--CoA ligase, putative [Entamoeba histolytica HM-1:IMSS-B]|uniref:Long-chain-fatty-acid--CoA ligase, putative n=5 Tax=Entamoeba histolytica TaxID=5759 RepID=C4M4W9_ENTH1|nr:long-chain-fatty-acid--CoA ligase, putative [Entamoeba histolytica HM-1:IMSS]EMH74988.1 long-chain-fatty-acid--CoA ligase, putative [Entamoeba histolytica HM-1:IMSS-B]EMS13165.1 long-chain-fatty-acid CoA ligase [Entamoeba histolytica HM-3:IMSS]ENY60291.1 long-chain-fatty-acid CoA ligase, putative [Entamoeba histolytica HM-1:IMSS-A]GAT96432.1 long-chain-fatty-acid--coa ligase putative [Entamoeba histolytica]EAL47263.1 long-chain-fatty-acid--CoA ligase, putative [Entamoeba histolytica HM-1:IM|eukprot:XP_652649.1 long-chain-fatty-acid--CoA ligase, putative [Entamoeba histolytica HM-1:IMSS]